MNRPITSPNIMPIASTTGKTTQGSSPLSSEAATTVVRARMPLTDRSMPPEMITKVSPTTMTIRNGAVLNRLKNACPSRMAG